jgi:hypothetical protein
VQATAKTTGTGSVGDGGKAWQGSLASLKASASLANCGRKILVDEI